jgi:DNA-binding transcriptional ArsR family regulator
MAARTYEVDATALRAIAHPLRMRMLGILRTEGPATATSLGARLGESSGTTSWHLRQLAEHGFIEEDPDRGNRRDRWWRAAHQYTNVQLAKFLDNPEDAGAASAFLHEAANIYYRNAVEFVTDATTWSTDWIEAAYFSDDQLTLTPAELTALGEELWAVIRRYKRERRPGDEAVSVQFQAFPRRRP